MSEIDPCPRCGSDQISGPTPSRRKTYLLRPKFQKQMRYNCRGCDHVYQFDVSARTYEARERQAAAMWAAARPAQMEPTKRLAAELGLID